MTTDKQRSIYDAVWRWRDAKDSTKGAKDDAGARIRAALIQVVVMVCIGLLLQLVFKKVIMARIVWSLAGVVLVSGLFIPPVFRAIERFGAALGRWAAVGLTWLLLVPFFYLFFVPGRMIIKLKGKDPMCRKCPTDLPTYWVKHAPIQGVEQYRKQH
jgi:hypothetical protein